MGLYAERSLFETFKPGMVLRHDLPSKFMV